MKLQKLATAARDGLLSKTEELVGRMAISETTAKVVSRSAFASESHGTRRLSLRRPFVIADPNPTLYFARGKN